LLLLKKDCREILASRAYWLMLAIVGPLVGHAFVTAVNTYADASHSVLPQGLLPLDGILVPTFGIYDLAATFFFPFVAIRLVAAERESGAWTLLLQTPYGVARMLGSKALALTAAWIVAWIPGLIAILLWCAYGGHVNGIELTNLLVGHLLRGWLTIGVAMAAAAIAASPASAAIVCLGFTVGAWALDFVQAGRGLAAYTPENALRSFETGLFSPAKVIALAGAGVAGMIVAMIWMGIGKRSAPSILLLTICAAFGWGVSRIPASTEIDLSEDRRHSFSPADARALHAIAAPLHITVRLGPDDPRRTDLDHNVLAKLARVMPKVDVEYPIQGRAGAFDASHYGEVWYELGDRKVMSRSTTEPIVLEIIYALAGVKPAATIEAAAYPGYPLVAQPAGAWAIFTLIWPAAMAVLFWFSLCIALRRSCL
jgi:ABC-2 type transport system permease protein